MNEIARHVVGFARPRSLAVRASLWALLIGAGTALGAIYLDAHDLGSGAASIMLYLVVAACVVTRVAGSHTHAAFGAANAVTLFRAGLISLIAAVLFAPALAGDAAILVCALAFVALSLDGIDGWLARRSGLASTFGARFDLEIDALFVLILAAFAYTHDKAGAWVLLIGLMRYAFFFAGRLTSKLEAPLPELMRRKTVCVVQIAALALLLLPQIVPPISTWMAAIALLALAWSFAVDIRFLLRQGQPA